MTSPAIHRYMGRIFTVKASFPDTLQGEKDANSFMENNPGVGLLEIKDGLIILADNNDRGQKVLDNV